MDVEDCVLVIMLHCISWPDILVSRDHPSRDAALFSCLAATIALVVCANSTHEHNSEWLVFSHSFIVFLLLVLSYMHWKCDKMPPAVYVVHGLLLFLFGTVFLCLFEPLHCSEITLACT